MTGDLVLLTGAVGHLGFKALQYAVNAGYRVRAAVRCESRSQKLLLTSSILAAAHKTSQLTFAYIPDIGASGAYYEAIKDVKFVIHIASPIPELTGIEQDHQAAIVEPAVRGTFDLVETAQKAGTVQRIVITSSTASITEIEESRKENSPRITSESRVATPQGPFKDTFEAYIASKTAAFNEIEKWLKLHEPAFDVVHIHPSYILGRNDLSTTTQEYRQGGSNMLPVAVALGIMMPDSVPIMSATCDLDDTARIHVEALDPKIPGNQSYIISSPGDDGMQWNDVTTIVSKYFPEAVKSGVLANNGSVTPFVVKYDSSKTEEVFGFKQASFESQIVSVISHYLEIYEREQAAAGIRKTG